MKRGTRALPHDLPELHGPPAPSALSSPVSVEGRRGPLLGGLLLPGRTSARLRERASHRRSLAARTREQYSTPTMTTPTTTLEMVALVRGHHK